MKLLSKTPVVKINITKLFDNPNLLQGIGYSPNVRLRVKDSRGKTVTRGFGGNWVVQQALSTGAVEDQRFTVLNDDGTKVLAVQTFMNSGHGNGMWHMRRSVLGNLYFWTGWEGTLARTLFKDGNYVLNDKRVKKFTGHSKLAGWSPIPTDPFKITVRQGGGTTHRFFQYQEQSVTTAQTTLGAKPKLLRMSPLMKKAPGVNQGSAAFGNYIYVVQGKTNYDHAPNTNPQKIHKYDWKGKEVEVLDLNAALRTLGYTSWELEGLNIKGGRLIVGVRVGSARNRWLNVFEVSL